MKTFTLFSILCLLCFEAGLAQNGLNPDPEFSNNGVVVSDNGDNSFEFSAIQIQPDGKLVTFGPVNPYLDFDMDNVYKLARYHADGSLDTAFGTGGFLLIDSSYKSNITRHPSKQQLKLQPDGKIVLLQLVDVNPHPGVAYFDIRVKRYNANGTPDITFGNGGETLVHYGNYEFAVALEIQPDGKILVGGNNDSFLLVFRLNANGTIDQNFADNGFYEGSFNLVYNNSHNLVRTIKLQGDGKIILGGSQRLFSSSGEEDICALRLNTNGTLDTTFGDGGKFMYDSTIGVVGDVFGAMQLLPDDRLVFFSHTTNYTPITPTFLTTRIIRVTANGQLDASFGAGGTVIPSIGDLSAEMFSLKDAIIDSNQRMIVSLVGGSTTYNSAILRFNPDGSPDTSFHQMGYVTLPTLVNVIAIQDDGKFLFGGTALWRYGFGILSSEAFEKNRFAITPNPFTDQVTLHFNFGAPRVLSAELLDGNGRLIHNLMQGKTFAQGDQAVEFHLPDGLAKGVYLVRVWDAHSASVLKIIK